MSDRGPRLGGGGQINPLFNPQRTPSAENTETQSTQKGAEDAVLSVCGALGVFLSLATPLGFRLT